MSAFPAGYSNQNQYGSSFPQPPPPGLGGYNAAPFTNQPQQQGQTININMDPTVNAMMKNMMAQMPSPNNPRTNEHQVQMECPSCHQQITTSTEYVIGSCTILSCLFCFCMGCIILAWLPFILDMSKDVIHTCPSCRAECGRFLRQGQRRHRVGRY